MKLTKQDDIPLRIMSVFKDILDNPELYTRKALAEKYDIHPDTVKKYFIAMRKAGFEVAHNDYPDYCYYINNAEIKYFKK
jgi:DNA-binding IscR family transcriptional regulator